jgi:hypothetical protein
MSTDPVVAEIHQVREQIAARFGYNIRAIGEDARKRDAADAEVIRRPPRPPAVTARAKAKLLAELPIKSTP